MSYTKMVWQILSVVWTSLFGDSIAAFRGVAALAGPLLILGVFALARTVTNST
jgi:uncharacterized membrane protein